MMKKVLKKLLTEKIKITFSDKIATGSFDKTCKLWSTESGKCFHTFKGHNAEIVCLGFNPQSTLLATGKSIESYRLFIILSFFQNFNR
jgi:dynein assembly factor with WDR repeat domains 1